ncbi:MAG: hypothetical protein ACLU84_00295 [Clostridia bacterium]
MENASKALIIAASIIVGVMVLSVGVAIFRTFSDFSQDTMQKMEDRQLAQFNNQFYKYYGYVDGKQIMVSSHDIVTVANLAKQNNIKYDLQEESGYKDHSNYVQVYVKAGSKVYANFEKQEEDVYNAFLAENSLVADEEGKLTKPKDFICSQIKTSEFSQRVIYVVFTEVK